MIRILALLVVLVASPALAHSELRGSEPSSGAVLVASPDRVALRFNERVTVTTLRLRDGRGLIITLETSGGLDAASEKIGRLRAPLVPGAYDIDWAALSADGHPIGGRIRFVIQGQQ
jgi:methionine-rich copper-binding protein CopC